MATFISTIKFTDGETTKRAASLKSTAKKMGVKVKDIYWTLGAHDGLLVFDAPDDETATALMLHLGSLGNLQTTTARAFNATESLSALVATHQLKRRDKSQPEKVVILPPGPGEPNLRPMAWLIVKMLRKPDEGNLHAYAAIMIGYLGLEELEGELRKLLDSRHPAVTTAARTALGMIGANGYGRR